MLDTYVQSIKSGAIPSCLHVKNAISRYERDLADSRFIYRQDKIDQVVRFLSLLKHFEGRHSGEPFTLEPWELFIISNIYGFYWKDTNKRRFQEVYVEVARKNGKSAMFGGALGLYHLIADGEDAAQVLLAANAKEQAGIVYRLTDGFCRGFDPHQQYLRSYRSSITFKKKNSFLKVLAADSSKLDGYNASFGLVDEYHEATTTKVRDVIKSSMAMRENPLLIITTTAGFDKSKPCFDYRTNCTEVIGGLKQDDTLFSIIYTLDEQDDWRNPEVWIKSNPNLGITVRKEFIENEVNKAKNNPSDEVGVRTKNLNTWCDTTQTWIPDEYIMRSTKKMAFEDFAGRECYIGVDLASVQDFTAVSFTFLKDGRKCFKVKYYLPFDSIKSATNRELYQEWARLGYLTVTPGNVTDYDYITRDILEVSRNCPIELIYYDKYNANSWAIDATEIGLPLEVFSQTIGNFNSPTRELEMDIIKGNVLIDDNPITRFCFRNVALRSDHNGNVKPDKGQGAVKKIDGVIAMLQSSAAYTKRNANVYNGSIY